MVKTSSKGSVNNKARHVTSSFPRLLQQLTWLFITNLLSIGFGSGVQGIF
jgi:hypothetical protein